MSFALNVPSAHGSHSSTFSTLACPSGHTTITETHSQTVSQTERQQRCDIVSWCTWFGVLDCTTCTTHNNIMSQTWLYIFYQFHQQEERSSVYQGKCLIWWRHGYMYEQLMIEAFENLLTNTDSCLYDD